MKKIILIIIMLFWMFPTQVKAEEILSLEDFDFSESLEALRNGGYSDINFDEITELIAEGEIYEVVHIIMGEVYDRTIGNISFVEKTIINLVLIVLMSTFFTNFASVFSKDNVSDTAFYICYLIAITLMITLFEFFCTITADFVTILLEFVGGIIPAYFLSVAVMGQASATGFYQLVLVIIGVTEFVFLKVVIPMIKIYIAISLVNNVSQEDFLSRTANVICNFIKFINRSLISIVTGINIIQGLILPAVDNAKNTTIRKFVGSLPVVGDGSEAVTGIVLGSVNLIKNTIGTFAIVLIILLCLVPFIKIQIYSVSLQVVTAIIQPVADKRIINSFECMCNGTRMLGRVISSAALLFIISIAIICMVTGFKG